MPTRKGPQRQARGKEDARFPPGDAPALGFGTHTWPPHTKPWYARAPPVHVLLLLPLTKPLSQFPTLLSERPGTPSRFIGLAARLQSRGIGCLELFLV